MKSYSVLFLALLLMALSQETRSQPVINEIGNTPSWYRLFLKAQKTDGELMYYAYSSELDELDPFEGGPGKYTMLNLFDNDPATAWVEGVKGYGEGEYIVVGLGDRLPEKLIFRNGYQKSEGIYRSNSRPKTIKLTLYTGFFLEGDVTEIASVYRIKELISPITMLVRDIMGEQEIPIGLDPVQTASVRERLSAEFKEVFKERIEEVKKYCPTCAGNPEFQYILKIELVDVYRGSRWDDTCISDLLAVYKESKQQGIPPEDSIEDVYESDDMGPGIIFVDTDREKELILVDKSKMQEQELSDGETSFDIVLMDVSPDKEWAHVDIMFYQEGGGRVEEYSALYHVRSLQRVSYDILDIKYGMAGFFEEEGKVYLDTADGPVDLEELRLKIKDYQRKDP